MDWNLSPAVLVDVILIIVVVATVFHYSRKGFVAGLLDLVGNLASLVLAWVVSGRVSPTVFENFFKSGLIDKTAEALQQQGTASVTALLENLGAVLPQQLQETLTSSLDGILNSGAPDIAQQIVENIVAPLVVPLITVVVFFATFALCKLLVALLVAVLTNINRIPMLGAVNRTLGVVIGLVAGFINVMLILCLLWAIVALTNGSLPGINDAALSGSYFYRFFSAYNPFVS